MQKKKGVSLIVLVITIIVIIILAGTIVISLNNSGIFEKANKAVEETNLAIVKELASTAWLEAYADGARTEEELEQAVMVALANNEITEDKYEGYTLIVSISGVALEKIEYVDFELNEITLDKIGFSITRSDESNPHEWPEDMEELIIPETFYDEQAGVWYKVTSVDITYTGLKKIVIPDSVTRIYLEGNWYLETVNIPNGVTKIGPNTFTECFALKEIIIPNSVTAIESAAFSDMDADCSITIPNTVVSIGDMAFSWSGITEITYTGSTEEWRAIDLEDGWYYDPEGRTLTIHCTDGDILVE